jgi:cell wall-associated NlpC family hydrolase
MNWYLIITMLFAATGLALEEDSLETPASDTLSLAESIIAQAETYLGVPYVFGGTNESGFDCSGLTYRVFADHGLELPRTVSAIESIGEPVSREELQPGDLLIFHNPKHTGIYIGDGLFIHSSSWQNRGVVITELAQTNYARRYHSARRIIPAR